MPAGGRLRMGKGPAVPVRFSNRMAWPGGGGAVVGGGFGEPQGPSWLSADLRGLRKGPEL